MTIRHDTLFVILKAPNEWTSHPSLANQHKCHDTHNDGDGSKHAANDRAHVMRQAPGGDGAPELELIAGDGPVLLRSVKDGEGLLSGRIEEEEKATARRIQNGARIDFGQVQGGISGGGKGVSLDT